jgi:hypothetical protein
MDYEERKREIKEDLEGLKHDLLSIEDDELIEAYDREFLNKTLELEDIKLRIMYLCQN